MARSAARHVIAGRAVDHPVSESEGGRRSTWNLGKPLLWGRRALSRPCEHRRTTRGSTAGVAGFCVKPELQGPTGGGPPGFGGGSAPRRGTGPNEPPVRPDKFWLGQLRGN